MIRTGRLRRPIDQHDFYYDTHVRIRQDAVFSARSRNERRNVFRIGDRTAAEERVGGEAGFERSFEICRIVKIMRVYMP